MTNTRKNKLIPIIIIVAVLLICAGIGTFGYFFKAEIKFAVCMASEDKSKCLKILLVEKDKCEDLEAGIPIKGKSGLYSVTPPSEGWLKNGWGGRSAENKDLGILSETGTAWLDFSIQLQSNNGVEELSRSGIQWAIDSDKLSNGSLLTYEIPFERSDEKGFLSRYCWKNTNNIRSCAYYYAIPLKDTYLEISGTAIDITNQLKEMEEMILSIQLIQNE